MKEQLLQLAAVGSAIWLARNAFTSRQKKWFKERDEYRCQFPVDFSDRTYKPCGRPNNLEIHHVSPQRWSKDMLRWNSDQIDAPDNGITLCRQHHQDVIHGPDMPLARANYHRDKKSYKKAFRNRNELMNAGKKYWDDRWDQVFQRIVNSRNGRFDMPWPKKGER